MEASACHLCTSSSTGKRERASLLQIPARNIKRGTQAAAPKVAAVRLCTDNDAPPTFMTQVAHGCAKDQQSRKLSACQPHKCNSTMTVRRADSRDRVYVAA